jgi:hypothetical protein
MVCDFLRSWRFPDGRSGGSWGVMQGWLRHAGWRVQARYGMFFPAAETVMMSKGSAGQEADSEDAVFLCECLLFVCCV